MLAGPTGHRGGTQASLRRRSLGLSLLAHAAALVWIIQAAAHPGTASATVEALSVEITNEVISEDIVQEEPQPPAPKVIDPPPVPTKPIAVPKPLVKQAAPRPQAVASVVEAPASSEPVTATAAPPEQAAAPPVASAAAAAPAGNDDSLRIYAEAVWARITRRKPIGFQSPGTAVITFTLSTEGALLSATITGSSGSPTLDAAALEALHRAAPFPPPPPQAAASQLTFTIPYQFR
jgi:protein TonB